MSEAESTDCENAMEPGKIGWAELITSDPAGAIAYYTSLFGWETEPFTGAEGEYTMFKRAGVPFGGVMKTPMPDVPTHWMNYVSVEDIDAAVAKSVDLGGGVIVPPKPVPEVGRIAVLKDPQGAVIGLHEPPKAS